MKTSFFSRICLILALCTLLFSCHDEDPGPRQNDDRGFAAVDFDRLDVSDAFDVTIMQGPAFSITAKGDRRNLDDIRVEKSGNTLRIKYNGGDDDRQYTTYVTITMPVLYGLDFSGAVNGIATGFTDPVDRFDLSLSGSSLAQVNINATDVHVSIAGASTARLIGEGKSLDATVSGASDLTAFEFPIETAQAIVSGASHAKISVSQQFTVSASGASIVMYRGDPQVDAEVTGASSLMKE